MGNLKPIGSEKLEGTDKLKRIMEIARYNENIPNPINEDKSVDYKVTLSDGREYQIHKEKVGYVIKRTLNESTNDIEYLEPMKNRKYYSSYSQAFKRLNLIARELNSVSGYDKNISLFNEQAANEAKKYILKMSANEQEVAPETTPAPQPTVPTSTETPTEEPTDLAAPVDEPLPTEEPSLETDEEGDDEIVTFKTIQKITGKLGQKIREFLDNPDNTMSSKDIKYVVNSILSALKIDELEPEDKEEIMSKFEGGGDDTEVETEVDTEEPIAPEAPEAPESSEPVESEVTEEDEFSKEDIKGMMGKIFSEENDIEEEVEETSHMGKSKYHGLTDEEAQKMEEMIEGMFTESKVDNILKKYFKIDEKEKSLLEEKKKKNLLESKEKVKINNRIKTISESIAQEVSSKKLFSKYPKAKLLGKTNENNLVFEINNKKVRVTPSGNIK